MSSSTQRVLCQGCDAFQTMDACSVCEFWVCSSCGRHYDLDEPCVPDARIIKLERDNVYVRDVLGFSEQDETNLS